MANKTLFGSVVGSVADRHNEAGGRAYSLSDYHALAQLAATGCVNATFYCDAKTQLEEVLKYAKKISPEQVAKVAVFARQKGYMKDMPALLAAYLCSIRRTDLLKKIWSRVIDNGKMLRTFVQVLRSGVTGRKSLGSAPKKLIWDWFRSQSGNQIFCNSVGNDPSLVDILKMSHPKPDSKEKEALFGWMLGRDHNADELPSVLKEFEQWKRNPLSDTPKVPFEMLTAQPLDTNGWASIARNAKWHWTRMNLNTMLKHGVFSDINMVQLIAKRLSDRKLVHESKVFPYQLLMAYKNCDPQMPKDIVTALEHALEYATENVPAAIDGKVYICIDVSGSMSSAVTGNRGTATTKVTCVDVAGLMGSVMLRNNPDARVLPFDGSVKNITINSRDKVLVNARKLAINGGSTNCSAPLALLNKEKAKGDLVMYVSDNQSWVDSVMKPSGRNTPMVAEWREFKDRNKKAKLVCIDIQPYAHTQTPDSQDVLNVGGFSDAIWDVIGHFVNGTLSSEHWVGVIDEIKL